MAKIVVDNSLCTLCGYCGAVCPFHAIETAEQLHIGDGCTLCGECVRSCPDGALQIETAGSNRSSEDWNGILVFLQQTAEGRLHPVSLELLAEANRMAKTLDCPVFGVVISALPVNAALFAGLGLTHVVAFCHSAYQCFDARQTAQAVIEAVSQLRPSILLVGGTAEGRAMAPYVAVHFHTGLTADCTALAINEKKKLVQIRPAFGGNIMAQILTASAFPQIATVRPGVFAAMSPQTTLLPQVQQITAPPGSASVRLLGQHPVAAQDGIADAKLVIAIGRGVKRKEDIPRFAELAARLGGQLASSRSLVELGWMPPERQIGLSGWSVRPELLITLGISGSIQFRAGIAGVKFLCSVNSDPAAAIHRCSNLPLVGDLYEFCETFLQQLPPSQ